MFNVDFGESIIMSDNLNRDNLLIDYGSELDTNIDYIENKIYAIKSENGNIDAMMTHFHEDHINGFINLSLKNPKFFNKIYIPNVFSPYLKRDFRDISYVQIELILFFLTQCKFNLNNNKLSLFELLKSLVAFDGEIHILQRGDTFKLADTKYITLWPNTSEIKFMKNSTEEYLEEFLRIIGNEFDLLNKINKISQTLNENFLNITKIELRKEINIDELEKEIYELSYIAKKVKYNDRKEEFDIWMKKIALNANKISIVFQNKIDNSEKNILMTGDIDKYRLGWIINNKLQNKIGIHDKFNIIKAPHHGTKTYFFGKLPESKNIIISNGKTPKPNKRGKISSAYESYEKNGTLIRCTNLSDERCDFLEKGIRCKGICNKDNKDNKEIEITI